MVLSERKQLSSHRPSLRRTPHAGNGNLSNVVLGAYVESVRPLRGRADLVFPSPSRPSKPLSDVPLTELLPDIGLAGRATVHGFRTSFRPWTSERTSMPHAVAEMALAHRAGSDVEPSGAAYGPICSRSAAA